MTARRDTSSPGQALEFEVWSDLMKQSQGALHVFLPLLDRGFDAVLHRMTDGRYIPVQIKGRGEMVEGMVEIVVRGDSLVDDNALLIASLMFDAPGQLDLVVSERTFKQLAAHDVSQGHEVYSAAFSMHPIHSHWRPYLVPRAELAERILGASVAQANERLLPVAWRRAVDTASGSAFLARLTSFADLPKALAWTCSGRFQIWRWSRYWQETT